MSRHDIGAIWAAFFSVKDASDAVADRLYESSGYRVVRTMDFDFLPEREKQPEEVQQREGATFYEKPVADADAAAKL